MKVREITEGRTAEDISLPEASSLKPPFLPKLFSRVRVYGIQSS